MEAELPILVPSSPLCDNPEPEIEMMSQPDTSTKTEQNTSTNNILASTSKQPDTPKSSINTPIKKKPKSPNYKLKNKQINKGSASAALQIADVEIACRKELHEAQMANENQKLKNLLLKEKVLESKLLYYKNKNALN